MFTQWGSWPLPLPTGRVWVGVVRVWDGGEGDCWGRMCYIACSLQQFAIVICATLAVNSSGTLQETKLTFLFQGGPSSCQASI